jgi:serine/threonine protein kinase/WD40 repeat protein
LNADTREIEPDRGNSKTGREPELEDSRDPLDALAEEFLDRMRRGDRPGVSEFLARAPERARELEELLSALLLVEDVKLHADATSTALGTGLPGGRPELERLGDFRILRELGRGGMGIVYEAEQESLSRHVAIKVLASSAARSPQTIQRFLREARAAAQLHHTNIVPVFNVGESDGLHYYAMQFIRGLSLDTVLKEVRRLKSKAPEDPALEQTAIHPALAAASDSDERYARRVARIGLQVAYALEYAHQQGTLHRDIKPSNILLDVHGVAWVTDFGLAKAVEDEDLTRTGDLVGTIRYMAPERFRGRCDRRSDEYGLGLTLYELLALRPAFEASDRESLLYQVSRVNPARLRSLNHAIPVDLETIIHKAIEKEAEHRYEHVAELADDLRSFLEDRPIAARRVSSPERLTRWARRNPGLATLGTALAGMLAMVVVVTVVADLRLRRQHEATMSNLRRAELAERDAVSKLLDSYIASARAGRRSRFAGQRFEGLRTIRAAAQLEQPGDRLAELRNEAIACLALPDIRPARTWEDGPVDGFIGVDFDPVTGRLARGTARSDVLIRSHEPPGDEVRLPGNGLRAVMVRFSRDGRYLAVKHAEGAKAILVVWDTRRVTKLLEVADGVDGDAVDFHPNGGTFAAGRRDGSIVLYDLESRRELLRIPTGLVPHSIRFDSTGERIATVNPDASDAVQVRAVNDGKILASWAFSDAQHSVDWDPDGRWLAVGGRFGAVRLLDTRDASRSPRMIHAHDGEVVALAFHPGGRLLASASWDGTLRIWDLQSAEELVRCPLPEPRPLRFSRDGRFLGPVLDGALASIWELAEGAEYRSVLRVERDGARILFAEFVPGTGVLVSTDKTGVRLQVPGERATAFLALPGTAGLAMAPDGSYLITSGATGLLRWPIARSASEDLKIGPPEMLGPLAGLPTGRVRLDRDGRTLAVVIDGEVGRVVVLDLEGRGPLVNLAGHPNLERVDLSPDGRWVATGTWQGRGVRVWDARRDSLAREIDVKTSADVLFGPEGRSLVTASGDEYGIWDLSTWNQLVQIPRRQAAGVPGQAAFSPAGEVLAIARTRSLVQLVDVRSGRELATLEAHDPRNVSALRFSPDGRLLVVALDINGIRIWDLGAIRQGLESIGLRWPLALGTGSIAQSVLIPKAIVVEEAPWAAALARGEELARSERWKEAGVAFEEAVASGARHIEAQFRRALFRQACGDQTAYSDACRQLLRTIEAVELAPSVANDIAWVCALGSGAVADYSRVVHLAEAATASRSTSGRLNTLGAVLYRAGRFEEAVRQLGRAVEVQGAGGTAHDALFLAMAHQKLGHADEARRWLRLGTAHEPGAARKPGASRERSWVLRLELEILRREACAMIEPNPR